MIIVNGTQFRTLDQEIFVNGSKVIEAYANGSLVYPENRTGNFVKIKGKIQYTRSHSHQSGDRRSIGPWGSGNVAYVTFDAVPDRSFSLDISYAVIITLSDTKQIEYEHSDLSNMGLVDHLSPSTLANPIQSMLGGTYVNAQGVKTYAIKISDYDSNTIRRVAGKVKYTISPVPVCDVTTEMRNNGQITEQYEIHSMSDFINWPCDNNGEISTLDGRVVYKEDNNNYLELALYVSTVVSGVGILDQAMFRFGDVDIPATRNGTQVTLGGQSNITNIPITNILYIGNYETAPEWAKTVSDSDLD